MTSAKNIPAPQNNNNNNTAPPAAAAASLEQTKKALNDTASKHGFRCVPVSWEDAQRGTVGGALSCWGGNISDVRLWAKDGTLLYTLRTENWNERLGYVASKDVAVVVGNHERAGSQPTPVTLQAYLKKAKQYMGYAGVESEQLWDDKADQLLSVRFQAVFLPIASSSADDADGGRPSASSVNKDRPEFCTEVYNYNTRSDDDPRNMVLLCTAQGTSAQQDGAGAKKLFLHNVDGAGTVHRYWLEAEQSRHQVGGAQVETDEEAAAAAARGKATAIHIGTKEMGTRFNVQMMIQLPLQQKKQQPQRNGGFCFGGPSSSAQASGFNPSGYGFGATTGQTVSLFGSGGGGGGGGGFTFGGASTGGFGAPASAGGFGAPASAGGFGAPAFGAAPTSTGGFGAPSSAGGFGAPASTGGFGAPASAGGFGAPASAGGFGAPASAGGFGAPASAGGFGAPASTGGFGAPAFGAAPTSTGGFGAPASAGGFGAPASTGGFGAPAFGAAPTSTGGFGAPASAGGFGSPAWAGGFGAGGGLFSARVAPQPLAAIGTANAARVSRGSEFDSTWKGVANKAPTRDPSQHGTITVTLYYTVAGGVPSPADVAACVADLDALYKACPTDKRLVDCGEITAELTVKDTIDIKKKVTTQGSKNV